MHLAWTAIVPRSLVDDLDGALTQGGLQILMVLPHADPALRIVRCYRHGRRAAQSRAA